MFNIINFAESKTKNGCNLKLSAYVDDETEAGGHWEYIDIFIPYQKNASPNMFNPVTCQEDEKGNPEQVSGQGGAACVQERDCLPGGCGNPGQVGRPAQGKIMAHQLSCTILT